MGRTLHYAIYDDPKNYWEARREIRIAQELLLFRFTWTCEEPDLQFLNEHARVLRQEESVLRPQPPVPIAEGFTKVADDDWNAALLTTFVAWLSRRLPTATVTLTDEGDYLLPGYQIFRGGAVELDHERLAKQRAYLKKHGLTDYLQIQGEQMEMFQRGVTHSSIPAQQYADRHEIRALGFTPEELARMTLDEVAAAIAFPWTTEGLAAA